MENEVDYSRFYYKEKVPPPPSPPPIGTHEEDATFPYAEHNVIYEEKSKKRKKKGNGKKVVFGFFVLLLCFGLAFFCSDFFGKGFLTDAIGKAFSGETYEYYFVASPASSRYVAYADSLGVKQKGGGGYVMSGEQCWVAYAVYTDRTVASGVAMKNKSTEIYTVKYKTKNDLAKSIDALVKETEKNIADWEKGTISEAELSFSIQTQKESFGELKDAYTDNKRSLVDLIYDGLDSFTPSVTDKITQLSDMRYFLCCVIYSAQSVFS